MRPQDEPSWIAGDSLPVHPPLEWTAVPADTRGRQLHAPFAEELAEREAAQCRRLDMDDPRRVVGVHLGDVLRRDVDADERWQGDLRAVHVQVEGLVNVQHDAL